MEEEAVIEKLCGIVCEQNDIIRIQARVIEMMDADDPTEERAAAVARKRRELCGDIFDVEV